MKKLLVPLGLILVVAIVSTLTAVPALAHPGYDSAMCTTCHDPAGGLSTGPHDGAVGNCGSCHTTPGGSIHGQWTETTDACARCHRTHSASGHALLTMEPDALCEFCHGWNTGLAQTNVLGGIAWGGIAGSPLYGSLRGGGFEKASMNTSTNDPNDTGDPETSDLWRFPIEPIANPDELQDVTSKHSLDTLALIWGRGPVAAEPNAGNGTTTLECVSCHDPHNYGLTYRMLKGQPAGSTIATRGSTTYAYVTDQLAYAKEFPESGILSYTTTDYTDVEYASPDVYDADGNLVTVTYGSYTPPRTATKYSQQISNWCASCHTRYHAQKVDNTGAGSTDSGDAIFGYRHKTGDEMTDGTHSSSCGYKGYACHGGPAKENLNKQLNCLGCHVAHGTAATMSVNAQIPWPGADATTYEGLPGTAVDPQLTAPLYPWDDDLVTRSSLLRLDNRGTCQNRYCHQKGTSSTLSGFTQGMDK